MTGFRVLEGDQAWTQAGISHPRPGLILPRRVFMEETMIKVVCSWCDAHIDGPEDSEQEAGGICELCLDRFQTRQERVEGHEFDLGGEG